MIPFYHMPLTCQRELGVSKWGRSPLKDEAFISLFFLHPPAPPCQELGTFCAAICPPSPPSFRRAHPVPLSSTEPSAKDTTGCLSHSAVISILVSTPTGQPGTVSSRTAHWEDGGRGREWGGGAITWFEQERESRCMCRVIWKSKVTAFICIKGFQKMLSLALPLALHPAAAPWHTSAIASFRVTTATALPSIHTRLTPSSIRLLFLHLTREFWRDQAHSATSLTNNEASFSYFKLED